MSDRLIDRRKNWEAHVPMGVFALPQSELSVHDKCLYAVICGFSSRAGTSFPSVKLLSQHISCSRRQTFKSLAQLEEVGLIARQRQIGKNGGNISNLYELFGIEAYTPGAHHALPGAQGARQVTNLYEQENTIYPSDRLAVADATAQDAPPPPSAKAGRRQAPPDAIKTPSEHENEKTDNVDSTEDALAPDERENEIYPVTKAPETMVQTAAYLLLKTGRSKLSGPEIDALMMLDAHHYPAFIQKNIDIMVERFLKNGKPLRSLNFCYVVGALKNFAPTFDREREKSRSSPPQPEQVLNDYDAYAEAQQLELEARFRAQGLVSS